MYKLEPDYVSLLSTYRSQLYRHGAIGSTRAPSESLSPPTTGQLDHALWIIDLMLDLDWVPAESIFFMWLHFLQGILWSTGIRTLKALGEDLKNLPIKHVRLSQTSAGGPTCDPDTTKTDTPA